MTLTVLAVCGFVSSGNAYADRNPTRRRPAATNRRPSEPQRPPPAAAPAPPAGAHDRFSVLDLKIGMPVDVAGFTCAKTDDAADRHCVKFLDPRCSGRPSNIGTLRYGEKAPLGCFFDYSSQATYLDSKLLQVANNGMRENEARLKDPAWRPLINVQLTGTRSKPSKIYQIWYMFAPDELTEDSKLYAALVAKYGEPSSKNPPNEMRWKDSDTQLKANCRTQYCDVLVEDSVFEDLERRKQEEADGQARRKNAPSAPKL
ncbi:MAG: hypothetical protein ABI867_36865 [Kofleriaceae bacterium]